MKDLRLAIPGMPLRLSNCNVICRTCGLPSDLTNVEGYTLHLSPEDIQGGIVRFVLKTIPDSRLVCTCLLSSLHSLPVIALSPDNRLGDYN